MATLEDTCSVLCLYLGEIEWCIVAEHRLMSPLSCMVCGNWHSHTTSYKQTTHACMLLLLLLFLLLAVKGKCERENVKGKIRWKLTKTIVVKV